MANLIVEDKTGLPDANVYIGIADFKEFAILNGIDCEGFSDDQLAVFLVRATNFVDSFESKLVGKRLNPQQALAFPRVQPKTCNGMHLYDMRNWVKAVCYCVEVQCKGFSLLPVKIEKDDIVKKETIQVLEVQYDDKLLPDVILGKFPMVERYLSEYIVTLDYSLKVGR